MYVQSGEWYCSGGWVRDVYVVIEDLGITNGIDNSKGIALGALRKFYIFYKVCIWLSSDLFLNISQAYKNYSEQYQINWVSK